MPWPGDPGAPSTEIESPATVLAAELSTLYIWAKADAEEAPSPVAVPTAVPVAADAVPGSKSSV